MRIVLWLLGAGLALLGVVLAHRRQVRLTSPTLTEDLKAWDKAMPLPKPRQVYTGTQPVDRKALARALKGQKPTSPARRLRVVPDVRRTG